MPPRATRRFPLAGLCIFALATLSLGALGCWKSDPHTTVRIAIAGSGAPGVSPLYDRAPDAMVVQDAMFRGFLTYAANGSLRAEWATDVPSVTSGTFRGNTHIAAYTFRLRKGATFSDGQPMTFDDFMFTYRVLMHPLFMKGHAWWSSAIKGFTQAGDTLTFTVDRTAVHDALDIFPLPRHLLEQTLNRDVRNFSSAPFHQSPVGDGPFRFKSRASNRIDLERNPSYQPRPTALEHATFQFYETPQAALDALTSNAVDVVDRVPAEEVTRRQWPEGGAHTVVMTPGPRLVCLVFNTRIAPFAAAEARRALAQATNRIAIVQALGTARAVAADSWLQPNRLGSLPTFAAYSGDVEKARKTLSEAGLKTINGKLETAGAGDAARPPVDVRLLLDAESPDMVATAENVKKSWERLGLTVTIDGRPHSSYVAAIHEGAYTVALQAIEVYPWTLPSTYLAEDAIPSQRNNFHGENISRWASPENTRLLSQIGAQPCPAGATNPVASHQRLLAREVPLLPLYFTPLATVFRSDLEGVSPRTFGSITWNIEEWKWK